MTDATPALASRWRRLGGELIDGVVTSVASIPVLMLAGIWQETWSAAMAGREPILTLGQQITQYVITAAVFLALNGYLLAKRGQTIGKLIVKTRIVSLEGDVAPFGKILFLRYLPVFVVSATSTIRDAGEMVAGVSLIVVGVNALFIFGRQRRCLHDYLAGTRVVNADYYQAPVHEAMPGYQSSPASRAIPAVHQTSSLSGHCPHCRAPLEPNARFCVACGKPVSGPAASPPPPVAPRYPTPPAFKAPRRRRSVGGVIVFLFLMVGVVLAGGYFYLNAQHPRVLADLKAKLLGSTSKPTASSPAPTGSGLTTAQIRTQWAEQALAESRLEDAERELKQAEELEPGSPAIQTLRKRLTETRITRLVEEAEQAMAKGQLREADQRLDQAAVLDPGSIAVQAARGKVTEAKETQRRQEEERAEVARRAEQERQEAILRERAEQERRRYEAEAKQRAEAEARRRSEEERRRVEAEIRARADQERQETARRSEETRRQEQAETAQRVEAQRQVENFRRLKKEFDANKDIPFKKNTCFDMDFYAQQPDHKALAFGNDGGGIFLKYWTCGLSHGASSQEEAEKKALKICRQSSKKEGWSKDNCKIYASGSEYVYGR